ncbi:MAG TPA: molybdopterin cofactor-binding domain-containing protein [Candidatus Binataceae bacterium]|nr:molybdopterin cofactor-binding domain-containing protein [Candidatus Binataceae bacterium]
MSTAKGFSRRRFLKGSGALVVGFSFSSTLSQALAASEIFPTPNNAKLDSWLEIGADGNATVFTGKVDVGMGVSTAISQIVGEELYLAPQRVAVVMGDTARTPDQEGTGASTTLALGAKPLRNAAAQAHLIILQRAATRLKAPVEQLVCQDGIVSVRGDGARRVSYGKLAGDRRFNQKLRVSGGPAKLDVFGAAQPKSFKDYTVVGTSVPRLDVAPKVFGQFSYACDIRPRGMLHGRVIRPPVVGATVVSVDDSSLRDIPGIVKVVARQGFVGVVAQTEWSAIEAASRLKVNWNQPGTQLLPQEQLYDHMVTVAPKASKTTLSQGDVESALAGSKQRVEATYRWPMQSHVTMGPGCAVAWVRKDGSATVWTGAQKPPMLQRGLAGLLGVPPDQVRIVWVADAGSYGRPGYADAAADAVLLSKEVGRPVRVQWMRHDMTGWGTKAPAVVCKLRGAVDPAGKIAALDFESWAFSGDEVLPRYYHPGNLLAAQLIGIPNSTAGNEYAEYGRNATKYLVPALRARAHIVPPLYPQGSPLRTSHMRDPEGPQTTFAVESFIDELAAAAKVDPIEFRLRHFTDPRTVAVIQAAARRARWQTRPSPAPNPSGATVVAGRGIAVAPRHGEGYFPPTYLATIAEVEVDRATGAITVKRFVIAHDCGLIVNPAGLTGAIEANLIQSMSRALKEEATWDSHNVTSVDWRSYPIVRSPDVPEAIEVELIDRPELGPAGAGEPSSRCTAAAIANAIFDATGVRLRTVPMTPARLREAMAAA